MKPLTLPWSGRDVPHAILDINRGCDVRCRACYNARPTSNKSLAQIASDLASLLKLRRLHTITLAGGEPLLHPDLEDIVGMVRQRGLRVALASNARALDAARAASLARAGLDLALLHIDAGQTRPDLTDPADPAALRNLRLEKLALVSGHGIAAGLLSTVFPNALEDVAAAIEVLMEMPAARYLVFTGYSDVARFGRVTGTIDAGMQAEMPAGSPTTSQTTNARCNHFMLQRFGARPFASLPSQGTTRYDAWLSYQAVVAYDAAQPVAAAFLTSSLAERAGLRLLHAKLGRHAFFHEESPAAQRLQLALNALSGGHLPRDVRLLWHAAHGRTLVAKHLVFQQAPTPDASGSLSICADCPDAVVIQGRLLPVCLADRVAAVADPSHG